MNNAVQSFYEAVVKDTVLREQLATLDKEVAGKDLTEAEQEAFIREKVLPVAKAAGFDLTIEELKAYQPTKGELSDQELSEVTGGKNCLCFLGGSGKASACFLFGIGENVLCFLGGGGKNY